MGKVEKKGFLLQVAAADHATATAAAAAAAAAATASAGDAAAAEPGAVDRRGVRGRQRALKPADRAIRAVSTGCGRPIQSNEAYQVRVISIQSQDSFA